MAVEVLHVAISLHNLHARLPFRYGIAEMTAMPQLFLQATCIVNGRTATGTAADGLAPKWFTKYAHTSYEHDVAEMLEVISAAARFAEQAGPAESVFALWQVIYQAQKNWALRAGYPPLLWNFGVSLVERALIDAFCRAEQIPFAQAVHENRLGIDLAAIHPQLRHLAPGDLLPVQPPHAIAVRHTVGMADPLVASAAESAECAPTTGDGLPCTLAENIRAYGLRRFKI